MRRGLVLQMVLACTLLLATGSLPRAQKITEPSAAELMDALMWGQEPVGGPFELTDHTGQHRTDADYRGKFLLIYFGYMFCPDICPTDLQAMASAIDLLGESGELVQPLFITVDPERDTPARLATYVPAFHSRLVGLTGSASQIKKVAVAYKVYYAKVNDPRSTDYILDHSAFTYFVDSEGRYLGFFPPGTTAERMIEIVRPHLRGVPAR